jgi:ATP-dependent RNA helicase DeaD
LKRLADSNPDIFSVVFCRTKRDTQAVAEKLIEDGYSAATYGDLSQAQRDGVMKSLEVDKSKCLLQLMQLGIDVDNITHVVNYQLLTKLKRTITVLVVMDVQEN